MNKPLYDSILIVSFGGPEGMDDVMPFLERVVSGRNVPRARLEEVAEHYYEFGGVSPINEQNRALIKALSEQLKKDGLDLPIYFGNRNWKPFIADALTQMKQDGRKQALAFFTSMFSCYSGCRQYRENIAAAQAEVGEGAAEVHKLRMGFNHPGFVKAQAERVEEALKLVPDEERSSTKLIFTAHSIPTAMAQGSTYELQLHEAAKLVTDQVGFDTYTLCFQSRSGSPHQPWLEPDIREVIQRVSEEGCRQIVVIPIGFVSDHMEVMADLDTEAQETADEVGIKMLRAGTVGTHPAFVEMISDLITERMTGKTDRAALGELGAWHDVCPKGCCQYQSPGRLAQAVNG